eukprot:338791_1
MAIVSNMNFNIDDQWLKYSQKLMYDHCGIIYSKYTTYNNQFKNEKNKNNIDALCIAKCIELNNGYPLLLMLLDTFSRDRVNGHKVNSLEYNIPISDDKYSIGYTVIKWWTQDFIFGRYISNKYPKKSDAIMHAVAELSRRVLPKYNFQPRSFSSTTICDSLNAFVKYTISFHNFVRNITTNGYCQALPIQFDLWIIPQSTKQTTKQWLHEYHNELNEIVYNEMRTDIYDEPIVYNEMRADIYDEPIWDLRMCLRNNGYKENYDYSVRQFDEENVGTITKQFMHLWKSVRHSDMIRYKRYIIIIDRRNPLNLRQKNMGHIKPIIEKQKIWKDTAYLIAPKHRKMNSMKQFHTKDIQNITKKYYLFPEALLGYSKYLFPNPSKRGSIAPIPIFAPLNGYKFCLSYHILQTDMVKVYWYANEGSMRFKLDDMKWLWKKCFQKINNEFQRLTKQNLALLNDKKKYGKELVDTKFQEFWTQVHDVNNMDFQPFLTDNRELFRDKFKEYNMNDDEDIDSKEIDNELKLQQMDNELKLQQMEKKETELQQHPKRQLTEIKQWLDKNGIYMNDSNTLKQQYNSKIQQICDQLSTYYKTLGCDYDILFSMFCEDNAFDDNGVSYEINVENLQNCMLIEFDPNFPFPTELTTNSDRKNKIFNLLKICYDNPNKVFRGALDELKQQPNKNINYESFNVENNSGWPNFSYQIPACSQQSGNLQTLTGTLFKESIHTTCSSIVKVIQALEFYQQINMILSELKLTFIDECHSTYKFLSDDFIHVITEHHDDPTVTNMKHNNCNLSNCTPSQRHQKLVQEPVTESKQFIFLVNLLDSIHFYMLHRYNAITSRSKNEVRLQRFNITLINKNNRKLQTIHKQTIIEKNDDRS